MQPPQRSGGWVRAGTPTGPHVPWGCLPLHAPSCSSGKGDAPPSSMGSPAGDEGQCHIPSPVTELVPAVGLDPLGYPSGDPSAHCRLGVLISGISQGHVPMGPTCLSAWRASPPSAPPDPVSTSYRHLGQSMRPGKAFSDAPLYQVSPCPTPAHRGLPEQQCLLIFLPLLHPVAPQSQVQLRTRHVPVAKGRSLCPGAAQSPRPLGWLSHPGHLEAPTPRLRQGGEQSPPARPRQASWACNILHPE